MNQLRSIRATIPSDKPDTGSYVCMRMYMHTDNLTDNPVRRNPTNRCVESKLTSDTVEPMIDIRSNHVHKLRDDKARGQ